MASLTHDPAWPRAGNWPALGAGDGGGDGGRWDAVLLGAPASKTSLSPTGAHHTPAAVRDALRRYSPTLMGPPIVDLGAVLRIADAGDVAHPDGPDGERELRERVRALAARSGLVIALGGDNSITYAVAQGTDATGLITLDAHFDLRDGISNGSPVRRLVADGQVGRGGLRGRPGLDGSRVVQIGIADFANSAFYAQRAADLGIRVITLDEVRRRGIDDVIAEAHDVAGGGRVVGGGASSAAGTGGIHLDIDVDVCDRSVAPACPASVPGGLQAWELRALVRGLGADPRVGSADIVEVDATADTPDARTVRLAALCVLDLLAAVHLRKAPDA